jgi:hypothetical protein
MGTPDYDFGQAESPARPPAVLALASMGPELSPASTAGTIPRADSRAPLSVPRARFPPSACCQAHEIRLSFAGTLAGGMLGGQATVLQS